MKVKDKIKLAFWVLLSGGVGIFFASFTFSSTIFNKTGNIIDSAAAIGALNNETGAPQYFYANKATAQPKLSAQAYLVGDLNTGEVILSKNQDAVYPIASTSKLMTALVTTEITDAGGTAQVSKKALATEGSNGGLRTGEKIKTTDLIYPLLLESSNDAAEILAEHFGRDSFIRKMNLVAENLKMSGTKYEDPSGLSPNNRSTVADLFKLSGYLNQEKPDLLKITTKRSFSNKKHSWSNIGQFLGNKEYIGGKSGYTDEARQTVVSLFSLPLGKTGSRPIAIVLLKSQDRKRDVENILKYLKKNIYYGGKADATTDWVREKIGTPDVKDPDFVNIAFVGDIMLARGVKSSVVRNFKNDYSNLFAKLDDGNLLKKSDIVFGNLEGVASDKGKDRGNLYSFRMDPAVVPAMAGAGIHVLSVANNHVGDWGRLAYIDTLARLKENEIKYTGGGNTAIEAETPVIIEKYGIKIGFLGFSDVGPNDMKAEGEVAGLLLASNPRFEEIIQNASKQVDHLVVSFHFGEEYKTKHNTRQELLAHKAVDNGAKLVMGHHPHVIQDTEVYKESFIAYSLGNFIFDQGFSKATMQGALLNIKLTKDGRITKRMDTVVLNKSFQPDKVIEGKEETVKF